MHALFILAGLLATHIGAFVAGYLVRRRHPTDPNVGPVKL